MNIYEWGDSAANLYMGKGIKFHNYACVLDSAQDLTIEEAFEKMLKGLQDLGHTVTHKKLPNATVSSGDMYVVAHEVTYAKDGTRTMVPSNILRHVLNRRFTNETLYVEESGEIIELCNRAMRDIQNKTTEYVGDFATLVKRDPSIIVEALHIAIVKNKNLGNGILDGFSPLPTWVQPITEINDDFAEILSSKYVAKFMSWLDMYSSLRQYFVNVCGLTFKATLDINTATTKPTALPTKKQTKKALPEDRPRVAGSGIRFEMPRWESFDTTTTSGALSGTSMTYDMDGNPVADRAAFEQLVTSASPEQVAPITEQGPYETREEFLERQAIEDAARRRAREQDSESLVRAARESLARSVRQHEERIASAARWGTNTTAPRPAPLPGQTITGQRINRRP